MDLVFIHGPAAAGKLTGGPRVGRAGGPARAFAYPDMPAGLTLDTGELAPEESARRIAEHIGAA